MDIMDIMSIIEDYVNVSVKWGRLNALKHMEEQYEAAALRSSKDTSVPSSYKMRKEFIEKAKIHSNKIKDLKVELIRVEQLLEQAHLLYTKTVSNMDFDSLVKLHNRLSSKIDELKRRQKEADSKRLWATQKADIAFRNHNYTEQKEYNDIASSSYLFSQDTQESLVYYEQILKVIALNAKERKFFSSKKSDSGYSI